MQLPLQITFRNIEPSESVAAKVRERAGKLERFVDKIIGCRVTIEAPHKHHHKGSPYEVRIDVTVPGSEIVVSRHPGQNGAHEDIYVAVRDAFNAMRRQLEEYINQRKGKVKSHVSLA
ncbi:MAG: HPF/RaiA family ribosome-associated protein [Gammaproteobacteria bacterium]|nr:HPF/RaiA family ribosome-associated protein [Gammaproteobacteria bacterium]MDH5651711.1 HPF/RaiA family ribosome-associated protein [Gammaproteobacteria bacterium]